MKIKIFLLIFITTSLLGVFVQGIYHRQHTISIVIQNETTTKKLVKIQYDLQFKDPDIPDQVTLSSGAQHVVSNIPVEPRIEDKFTFTVDNQSSSCRVYENEGTGRGLPENFRTEIKVSIRDDGIHAISREGETSEIH